ncbi:DUF1573 domain-containing protein [Planctomicrobium sp. SH527]|uniref:DUF1573 domain-containing protein n=1 Tax=Planctomicrobium sp. SH527 TaxID=3448123 RepID=UPI003F5CB6DC
MGIRLIALGLLSLAGAIWTPAVQANELNWAEKMFSELRHDFGTVARGADTRASIIVTNMYEENVTIDNVGTTCGCTAAKPDRTMLKTHEKAIIEIKMNTVKFMRRKDSNVDVTMTFHGPAGAATKTVRVPITAYIRSDVVITPEPGNADFGNVEFGSPAERHLEVAYAGRDNWSIKEVKVPNQYLEASVRETFRGPGRVSYDLTVRLKPDAPMGTIHDQVTLITDDSVSTEVPVLVMAKIEPDIVVSPAVLPLGMMKAGDVKEFRVVLRGKKQFSISQIVCDATDCFEVKEPTNELKTVHVVPFKVKAPERAGQFNEKISFQITGRPDPVTFHAEGTISSNP